MPVILSTCLQIQISTYPCHFLGVVACALSLCVCAYVPLSLCSFILSLCLHPLSPHNLKSQLMAALSPGCPVMLLYKADVRSPNKETSLEELVAALAAGRRA